MLSIPKSCLTWSLMCHHQFRVVINWKPSSGVWVQIPTLQSPSSVSWTSYLMPWVPHLWASLVAQLVKNLPTMLETWVWSLDWEDSLEKGKATHSSILVWRIQTMGSQRVRHDWATFIYIHTYLIYKIGMTYPRSIVMRIKWVSVYKVSRAWHIDKHI